MRHLLILAAALSSAPLLAEEGALTVELGGGGTAVALPTPLTAVDATRPQQLGTAALARGAVRYALTHWLELGAGGFFEPGVRYTHRDVLVRANDVDWPGALQHQVTRFGGTAGARLTFGVRWRLTAELQLGWSRRLYSEVHAFNTGGQGGAVEWPVSIGDFAIDNFLATTAIGVEYSLTDNLSLGIAPRVDVLIGRDAALAVSLPLVLSWSWSL